MLGRKNRRRNKRKIVMNVRVLKRGPADQPQRKMRRLFIFAGVLAVAVGLGCGYLLPKISGFLLSCARFKVGRVEVQNHYSFSAKDIMRLAELEIGQDLLELDLDYHRRLLERHPDIESAVIERHIPNRVRIIVQERAPVARILQKDSYLIDGDGVVLSVRKRARSSALPVIRGMNPGKLYVGRVLDSDNIRIALDILKYYMRSELPRYLIITAIDLSDRNNIVIVSKEIDEIRLGRGDIEYKLAKLLKVLKKRHRLTREAGSSYLDLRWRDVAEMPREGKV